MILSLIFAAAISPFVYGMVYSFILRYTDKSSAEGWAFMYLVAVLAGMIVGSITHWTHPYISLTLAVASVAVFANCLALAPIVTWEPLKYFCKRMSGAGKNASARIEELGKEPPKSGNSN